MTLLLQNIKGWAIRLATPFSLLFFSLVSLHGQDAPPTWFEQPLSNRIANYTINVALDTAKHQLNAEQTILWINPSDDTIRTIPFHLYLNAFRNNQSTFYLESPRSVPSLADTSLWSWINIHRISVDGVDLSSTLKYIQPDDDNIHDKTVAQIKLDKPILPKDSATINLNWTAQLSKVNVRTGYSKDFYLQAQWFPKIGVYEPAGMRFSKKGQWNCHQYHSMTEYYADFGTYHVHITTPKGFIVGATGTNYKNIENSAETITHSFYAEDVIDFTWTAYPDFLVVEEEYKGIHIQLLIEKSYECCTNRYLSSAKYAIDYLEDLFIKYPFPVLTITVPPFHAGRVGAMEYPTFITAPGLYRFPSGIRSPEYFVIHELVHQYFMMMVATNEFEEAWMDEGFTSYIKSRILDHTYGDSSAVVNYNAIHFGAMEFFRSRYVNMENIHLAESTRFGWEYPDGSPRGLFYSKPATWLKTLEGLVGQETMDKILETYFDRWKFKHPCRYDFIEVVNEVVTENHGDEFGENLNWFFDAVLYGTGACDYAVGKITNRLNIQASKGFINAKEEDQIALDTLKYTSKVVLERLGEIQMPVDVLIHFDNGNTIRERWDGKSRTKGYIYQTDNPIDFVEIDPEMKIYMDINILNNSKRAEPDTSAVWKYLMTWMVSIQQVFQSLSFFI